jgi:hypothetical protein
MKLLKASDLPAIGGAGTEELLKSSREARLGLRFIQAGALLVQGSTLVAAVIALCMAAVAPALAQGSILDGINNDASRPVRLAKRFVQLIGFGIAIYGVYGCAKGVARGINQQQGWGSSLGWGAVAFCFGSVVAWMLSEARGNEIALPE